MDFNISSKLPHVGTTIFSVMSQLASSHQAINLSQGFPDFNADPYLIQLVNQASLHGHNQYAPMPGLLSLREIIANKVQQHYQVRYNPMDEITITAGGSEAIFSAIACTINPGDEVIIFEPAYDLYRPAVELFGGKVKSVQLLAPAFEIDWNFVQQQVSNKTKLIIINNPNNPSTTLLKDDDFQALSKLVDGTNILIISDEVYEHLVYETGAFISVSAYPILKERSFITYSFGKLLHTTGWKIGYCLAPAPLMQEFRKVHQFNVFSVNTPMQYGISQYLKERTETYDSLAPFFKQKRDYLLHALNDIGFKCIAPAGTYFLIADYSSFDSTDDISFATWLTEVHKVATIPLSAFYQNPPSDQQLIRFCYAKEDATLQRAVDNLKKL